jgi:hypothetical protein
MYNSTTRKCGLQNSCGIAYTSAWSRTLMCIIPILESKRVSYMYGVVFFSSPSDACIPCKHSHFRRTRTFYFCLKRHK